MAGDPVRDPVGSGVVSGCRQTEIAEAGAEFGQERGRGRHRLFGVEGVVEVTFLRRAGHELRDALGTGRTRHASPEARFLPDQPRQKLHRDVLALGRRGDEAAKRLSDALAAADRCRFSRKRHRQHGHNRRGDRRKCGARS